MADPTLLAELLKGVESWNAWREANQEIEHPDLSEVDFTADEYKDTALYWRDDDGESFIDLNKANFEGAGLGEANIQGADLREAKFQGAELRKANLQGADLWKANLQSAILVGAQLQGASIMEANLQDAQLERANLRRARLANASLANAHIVDADLRNGYFVNVDFWRADLFGAMLQGANLEGADLEDANLELASLEDANLEGASLQGAILTRANLEGAEVTDVQFSRGSRQRNFQGIRVSTCYGNQIFKSFTQDQDYIETMRASGKWGEWMFRLWYVTSDCGRSVTVWACWALGLATLFGYLFYFWIGPENFVVDHLPRFELFTMIYYSVVTFTTLGFGDIKPATETAAMVVMTEVILGYIMLGGLVAIFANKVARRS